MSRKSNPLYSTWKGMRQRCRDPKFKYYDRYGGRGISVCQEWNDFDNFYQWAITNGWRAGLTLERENNDGNYEPNNCKFVTRQQQCHNRKSNIIITAFGETKLASEWIKDSRCIVPEQTFRSRIKLGWNPEDALATESFTGNRIGPKARRLK
jgi:hypothetical protein